MLCERCGKNPATAYFKEIVNGQVREMHLCAKCSQELGSPLMPGMAGLADFGLGSLLGSLFTQSLPETPVQEKRCSFCGCGLSELAQKGQVGCPHCYREFYQQLLPSIERIHGKTRHVGKVPKSAPDGLRVHRELEELKRGLSQAVAAQEYEKAAQLRDRIRALEGKQPPQGGADVSDQPPEGGAGTGSSK